MSTFWNVLLIILFVQISAMGSLFHANQVAKKNCEALIRALRNEPAEKVAAVLEEYLAHDEGSYFLLAERFPEQEEPAISPEAGPETAGGEVPSDAAK